MTPGSSEAGLAPTCGRRCRETPPARPGDYAPSRSASVGSNRSARRIGPRQESAHTPSIVIGVRMALGPEAATS